MAALRLLLSSSALCVCVGLGSTANAQMAEGVPTFAPQPVYQQASLTPIVAPEFIPPQGPAPVLAAPVPAPQPVEPAPVVLTPLAANIETALPVEVAPSAPVASVDTTEVTAAPLAAENEEGAVLTLEDAIARALTKSPERLIAGEQTSQAKATVDEARAAYFPQVYLKMEHGREYNDPYAVRLGATTHDGYNWGNNESINVRQMLFDGHITRETVRQRLQQVKSSKLSQQKISEQLIAFTVEVYMELRNYQQVSAAAQQNLAALREIGALVDLRVKAGDASQVEQNYMKARIASAEQSYITAQASLTDAFNGLTYLIGDVKAFEAVSPNLENYQLNAAEDLLKKAAVDNTEMRILETDRKAATHELNALKGRYMPTVDLVMDANRSEDLGGATGTRHAATAKVQVGYRLFDGGLRSASLDKQSAKLREIDAREIRIKRDLEQAVKKSYNKRETNLKELQVVTGEIAANADLEKLYRKQFGEGDIDITQLVESQERIFSAQVKKAKLESELVNVTFELLRATADLLPKFCQKESACS